MLIFVFLILYFLSVLLLFIVDSCPKFLCNIEYIRYTVNASFFHQHNKKNIFKKSLAGDSDSWSRDRKLGNFFLGLI